MSTTKAALAALWLCWMGTAAAAETYGWVQYVPGGLEARAVTDQKRCPALELDAAGMVMQVRAAPSEGFAVTTCAAALPPGAKVVRIGDAVIPLSAAAPKRIAVLGDTGCRLKGSYIQGCNDPAQWPFRQVAAAVGAQNPDLIIHVGDYHYRETPCPEGEASCAGSPFGDTWAVWNADFFSPAGALLTKAPWVFVRGNHEDCTRGGKGWSRALEPQAFDAESGCNGPSPPFVVQLPGLALAVIDVAVATEPQVDAAEANAFHAQYAALAGFTAGPLWLLQHRPIWSAGGTVAGLPYGDNKTLAAAATGMLPANVEMMLSGHHHIFQVLEYADNLPVQIVTGHGGDYLNKGASRDPAGWVMNGVTVKAGVHRTGRFGFAMLEEIDGAWVVTDYDQTGAAQLRCGIKARQAVCKDN